MNDFTSKDKKVYVLDTTALIARIPLYLSEACFTTQSVLNEVKDKYSLQGLELTQLINRITVIKPSSKFIWRTLRKAVKVGEVGLSKTDIEVAALALQLKDSNYKVVVITDDYALQNLLAHLCIEFKPLRTKGIDKKIVYEVYCPNCNWKLTVSYGKLVTKCPRCGMKLSRRVLRTLGLLEECNEVAGSSMNMRMKP